MSRNENPNGPICRYKTQNMPKLFKTEIKYSNSNGNIPKEENNFLLLTFYGHYVNGYDSFPQESSSKVTKSIVGEK